MKSPLAIAISALVIAATQVVDAAVTPTNVYDVGAFNDKVAVDSFDNLSVTFTPMTDITDVTLSRQGEVSVMLPTAKKGRWGSSVCTLTERSNDLSVAKTHRINADILTDEEKGYSFISAPFKLDSVPYFGELRLTCSIKTPLQKSVVGEFDPSETEKQRADPYRNSLYAGIFFSNGPRGIQTIEESTKLSVIDQQKLFQTVTVEASGDKFNYKDGLRLTLKKALVDVDGEISLGDNMDMMSFHSKEMHETLITKCNGEIDGKNVEVTASLGGDKQLDDGYPNVLFTFASPIPSGKNAKISCPDVTGVKKMKGIPVVVKLYHKIDEENTAITNALLDVDSAASTASIIGAGVAVMAAIAAFMF